MLFLQSWMITFDRTKQPMISSVIVSGDNLNICFNILYMLLLKKEKQWTEMFRATFTQIKHYADENELSTMRITDRNLSIYAPFMTRLQTGTQHQAKKAETMNDSFGFKVKTYVGLTERQQL